MKYHKMTALRKGKREEGKKVREIGQSPLSKTYTLTLTHTHMHIHTHTHAHTCTYIQTNL